MQAQLKAVNPSLSVFLTSAPVSRELQLSNCLQTECHAKELTFGKQKFHDS